MRRKLFNFIALLSLLLCVATVVLWVRSEVLEHGELLLERETLWIGSASSELQTCWHMGSLPRNFQPQTHWGGFMWHGERSFVVVFVPYWSMTLILAILPATWFVQYGESNAPEGCLSCGYDLTGNTSGVCPECGTPVAGKAGA